MSAYQTPPKRSTNGAGFVSVKADQRSVHDVTEAVTVHLEGALLGGRVSKIIDGIKRRILLARKPSVAPVFSTEVTGRPTKFTFWIRSGRNREVSLLNEEDILASKVKMNHSSENRVLTAQIQLVIGIYVITLCADFRDDLALG